MSENYTELQKSESLLFEQLFENAQVGLVYVDGSRLIVKGNQRLADIFGYDSPQEMLGKSISSLHVDEKSYLEFGEKFFYSLRHQINIDIECPLRKKDASVIICSVSGKALDERIPSDLSYGVLWSVYDITQKHLLELKLEEERQRFSLAIEGAQDGLWDWNILTGKVYLSDRFCTMLGYKAGELIRTREVFYQLVHPEDKEKADRVVTEYLENKGRVPYVNIYRLRMKNGEYKWLSSRGKAFLNAEGKLERFTGFITDISEQMLLQKKLEYQHNKLQNVINGTPDLIFYKDYKNLDGEYIGCNDAFARFVGKPKSEILFHTDREIFSEEVGTFFRDKDEKILTQNSSLINEEWVQYPDGKEVLLATSKTPYYDTDNNKIGVVGVSRDITKSKSIEKDFERLSVLLHNTINSVENLVFVKDIDLKYVECNEAFEKFMGHTKEELIGKDDYSFFPKDLADKYHIMDQNTLDTGTKMEDSFWVTTSDARQIYMYIMISPLRDSANNIIGIVGSGVDLSHQKYLEDEINEQHQYLQSVINGVADPIMVIKEDYSIQTMNNILKKNLKNLKLADPANPKCYEVSHHRSTPCDGVEHPCPLRDVLESGKHVKVIHKHADNKAREKFVELSATPLLDKKGECSGIIELARDITEYLVTQDKLTEQKDILDYQAHHDALTGLPNRVLFEDRLQHCIESSKRNASKTALLFIDLDHFKEINDSLGHLVGDEVLKVVASRLQKSIRKEDTLARLGGDEFTIILGDLKDEHSASLIAKTILESLCELIVIDNNNLYVSTSIGISIYPDDGVSTENLLKYADSAMYKAKSEGRNNYQYYNSALTELAFERVFMEASLREAIQKREFVIYYQPQVNGIEDKLIGMEALVRWQHPTLGLLAPSKFIALAERTGLIIQIDRYVMQVAMLQMREWYTKGFHPGQLAINISVKNLEQQDFLTMFETMLEETQCKPEWIELEVTESQVMTHPEESIKILQKISALGVDLAIDDFGTGYSSLAYLKKLPINKLKIDQAFIKDLPYDEEDAGITKAVIALAQSLNLKIIAEGVEREDQKDFVTTHGCLNIQGYFYSQPIPKEEIEKILTNKNYML